MTHNERRLLCLVARTLASAIEEDSPKLAHELRVKVGAVQRDACVKDAERRTLANEQAVA